MRQAEPNQELGKNIGMIQTLRPRKLGLRPEELGQRHVP